ncbi:hypothetical protein ACVWZK_002935 [Bradyrhizobium sp. GM0.4]
MRQIALSMLAVAVTTIFALGAGRWRDRRLARRTEAATRSRTPAPAPKPSLRMR